MRDAITVAAAGVFASDPDASVEVVARTAGISRATFYRHFRSKADLLAALDLQAGPDSRQRVLAAAADLIGKGGLRGLVMEDLAEAAGVSRATVYRLFPNQQALFQALVSAHAPFAQVTGVLDRLGDQPPEVVLPAVADAVVRAADARSGILRTLFLEVMSEAPEARAGHHEAVRPILVSLTGYLAAQMDANRLRRTDPLLAAQSFMGPLLMFVLARPFTDRLAGPRRPPEEAAAELVRNTLHGLLVPNERVPEEVARDA